MNELLIFIVGMGFGALIVHFTYEMHNVNRIMAEDDAAWDRIDKRVDELMDCERRANRESTL